MAENKTKATKVSVSAFIDALSDPSRRADAKALLKLMQKAAKKKPRNMITYDFSPLYTSIPHDKLKHEIKLLVEQAFN